MFQDFSNRGPEDQAFLVGQLVADWQHAVVQMAQAVILLSEKNPSATMIQHICLSTDTALMKLANFTLAGLHKPEIYYEIAPFLNQPDPVMISEYVRLRGSFSYHSPFPEEQIQQAISKLMKNG